jgi:integrase/recombinase XerD
VLNIDELLRIFKCIANI